MALYIEYKLLWQAIDNLDTHLTCDANNPIKFGMTNEK